MTEHENDDRDQEPTLDNYDRLPDDHEETDEVAPKDDDGRP